MHPSLGLGGPVEEHPLDPDMIVEPLHVAHLQPRAGDVQMQSRRSVRRQRQLEGVAQRVGHEEPGKARAARGVRLQHVGSTPQHQLAEVAHVVGVFARRHLDRGRHPVAHQAHALDVVRGHRLLEPADAERRASLGEGQRLLARQGAVGVDEKADTVADRLARDAHALEIAPRFSPDLHLDIGQAIGGPAAKLLGELPVGVGGEAAAAVDRHRVAPGAQQLDDRHPQQLSIQIVQGDVAGGDRRGTEARAP